MFGKTADPRTKANVGSQLEVIARNPITLFLFTMPDSNSPNANIAAVQLAIIKVETSSSLPNFRLVYIKSITQSNIAIIVIVLTLNL